MSTISSVSLSASLPQYYEIPVESSATSRLQEGIVQLQFLGALQKDNPTQYILGVSMAQGISAEAPTINSGDRSKVDMRIAGILRPGAGSTLYCIVNSDGGDFNFGFSLNVNGSNVTYVFQKKKDRK